MGVRMTRIDLHTHSTHSDGTFGPAELVRLAAKRDLQVVALTDHDTTNGLPGALATGLEVGVQVVPGVEFSAEYLGTSRIQVIGVILHKRGLGATRHLHEAQ